MLAVYTNIMTVIARTMNIYDAFFIKFKMTVLTGSKVPSASPYI